MKFLLKPKKIFKNLKKRLAGITAFQFFLLLLVLFGVLFVVRYFGRSKNQWITVRVETAGQNWTTTYGGKEGYLPPIWINDHVKPGIIEYGPDGKELAIVDKVEVYEHGNNSKVFFNVRLKVFQNKNTKQFIFKNEPVQVGALIHFSFPDVLLEGEVIDINPQPVYKTLAVTVRLHDLEPWLTDKIKVNDMIKEIVSGDEVARITRMSLEPTLSQIYLDPNNSSQPSNLFLTKNPRVHDLVLEMEIEVEERNGVYYFSGNQIVKNSFDIFGSFGEYYLPWMEVIDIHE
jgi:hypothetical protein